MISVIIPTYKAPEALEVCLHSATVNQSHANQIIVVVDGFYDLNSGQYTADRFVYSSQLPKTGSFLTQHISDPFVSDSDTLLLIQSEAGDGNTTFTDSSSHNHSVSATVLVGGGSNDIHHETDKSKFGNSSVFFDGSGDFLQIPNHQSFDWGTNNFTIEAWVYLTGYSTNYYKSLIGKGDGGPNSTGSLNYGAEWTGYGYPSPYIHSGVRDFEIFITGPTYGGGYIHDRTWDDVREAKVTVWGFGDESFETATIYQGGANPTGLGTVFGDIKLSLNEWHHIAVVRSDSNMQLLVDNELDKTWTWTGTKFHSDYPMLIGGQQWTTAAGTETGTHPNGLQSWFDGYVEDIRISSGAR